MYCILALLFHDVVVDEREKTEYVPGRSCPKRDPETKYVCATLPSAFTSHTCCEEMENHTRLPAPGITVGVAVSARASTGVDPVAVSTVSIAAVEVSGMETADGAMAVTSELELTDDTDDDTEPDGEAGSDANGDGATNARGAASSADACPAHSNVVAARLAIVRVTRVRGRVVMITGRMS